MAKYPHQPLHGLDSIRLLRLKADLLSSEEPHVELYEASLNNKPEYEALSYCWDSPTPDDHVICENKHIAVTKNCVAALRRLLPRDEKDRVLLIDAICINQDDYAERSQQVTLMGKIFAQATRVLVWLGERADYSRLCLRGTRRISKFFVFDPTPNFQTSRALKSLLRRSWFRRTWIIQEVALAKDIMVVCGEDSAPWESLEALVGNIPGSHDVMGRMILRDDVFNAPPPQWHAMDGVFRVRNIVKAGKLNAPAALQLARRSIASIPHDRIFGLYGVCEELADAVGTPNYLEPLGDLYMKAAKALLSDNVLTMFWAYHCGLRNSPTWVPDFAMSETPWPWYTQNYTTSCRGSNFQTRIPTNGRQLLVKGKIIDTIESQSELTISQSDDRIKMLYAFRSWFALIEGRAHYPTGEELPEAFWKTVYLEPWSYNCAYHLRCDDLWLNAGLRYFGVDNPNDSDAAPSASLASFNSSMEMWRILCIVSPRKPPSQRQGAT